MKNQKVIIAVVICIVAAGLSFWGGMKYGQSKSNVNLFADRKGQVSGNLSQRTGIPNGGQQGVRSGGAVGGGLVSGEIISKDDTSMTIKLNDGGSKIVLISPSSKVEKTVDGTISDIVIGKSVMIIGKTNPDGSVSATSIQLRPAMAKDIPTKQ